MGKDRARGLLIQYCGQALRRPGRPDAENTHWTQHPLYAMGVVAVLLIACCCCCACCVRCGVVAGEGGPTDDAPTTAAPSPALAQEVARPAVQQLAGRPEAEADRAVAQPRAAGLNVLLGCATAAAAAAAAGLQQEEESRVWWAACRTATVARRSRRERGEAEADPPSPNPVLQGLNVLLSFFAEESEGEKADEGAATL